MAQKLEEMKVYQKATEFWRSVDAILSRPALCRNRKLHDQIADANDSITANISEGFEQPTDAAFANYLHHSKGSTAEVMVRLRQCRARDFITEEELQIRLSAGDELSRMLAGFIRYLTRCGWRDRGRFKAAQSHRPRTRTRD